MRRRSFLAGLVSIVAAPLAVEAQQAGRLYRIGYLSSFSPAAGQRFLGAFRQGLRDLGWAEGRNIVIEYRWAEGNNARLSGLAKELVGLNLDLIVSTGGPATARALKQASTTIPVVFVTGSVVEDGLVSSLARPSGNMTGIDLLQEALDAKRFELLKEAVPGATRVAVLWNPATRPAKFQRSRIEAAAQVLGVQIRFLEARVPGEIESALAGMARERPDALLVAADPIFDGDHQRRIVDLVTKSRVPTMYAWRGSVEIGGLMSAAPDISEMYRHLATFVDKILKGAKPADLPVEQPTKFELVINMKTARALGLTIPQSILLRADQVIE